eukprot:1859485-Pleurochrysis_carterae.AAC.3
MSLRAANRARHGRLARGVRVRGAFPAIAPPSDPSRWRRVLRRGEQLLLRPLPARVCLDARGAGQGRARRRPRGCALDLALHVPRSAALDDAADGRGGASRGAAAVGNHGGPRACGAAATACAAAARRAPRCQGQRCDARARHALRAHTGDSGVSAAWPQTGGGTVPFADLRRVQMSF